MAKDQGFFKAGYELLGSIKFTVFLLLTLAAGSLLGTLLPQGMGEREIIMRFGQSRAYWIQLFGLQDLYHSGWFQSLLALLSTNLVVCTLNRLPKTLKLLARKDTEVRPEKLMKFSNHHEFRSQLPLDRARSALEQALSARFGAPKALTEVPAYSAIAEKGRWSYWMLYVVHFSVILILFGALVGSIFGYKGFMNIPEGEASNRVHLFGGSQVVALPFEVRCDRFDVSFYENGMPKDYRSDLAVVADGREVEKRSIRVNDPLTYDGVTFYQSSYGSDLKEAEVELTDAKTKQIYRLKLPFQHPVSLPDATGDLQVVEYRDDLQGFGPALAIGLYQDDKEPTGSWILADRPEFHGNRVGKFQVKVIDLNKRSYTGLQVKKDPGVWFVLFGFTTLLIGMGMTFYSSHRKLWVWVEAGNPATRIVLAGRSNKNSLAFENEFNHLCEQLQQELRAK